jgi:hypothetical protein
MSGPLAPGRPLLAAAGGFAGWPAKEAGRSPGGSAARPEHGLGSSSEKRSFEDET